MVDELSLVPDILDIALEALLEQHPQALIGAVADDGTLTQLPATLAIGDRQVIRSGSTVDLVVPDDRVVIVRAWLRAHTAGGARSQIHLASNGAPATLHIFDARRDHGTFIIVVVADESRGGDPLSVLREPPAVTSRIGIVKKNDMGVISEADEATLRMLGWPRDELVGKPSYELVHPEDQARAIDSWMEMLSGSGRSSRWRGRHQRADGSWLWVEVTNQNLLDLPDHGHVLGELVDISDEMTMQESLRVREQLLDRLAQTVPVGLFQFDEHGQVTYTNDRLHDILGTGSVATVQEQIETIIPTDRRTMIDAIDAVLGDGSDQDLEVVLHLTEDGNPRHCSVSLRALTDDTGRVSGAIACVSDITDRARMQDELRHQATFDALTGCHNRASVMATLQSRLVTPRVPDLSVGVVFVDLDNFKPINDRFGHAVGDAFLQIVADRLHRAVRGEDIVGRLGGDEFLLVCAGISGPDEAMKVARRVVRLLHQGVELAGARLEPRASIGVACCEQNEMSADSLVAQADVAMYVAKRQRTGRPVLYEPTLQRSSGPAPA